MAADDETQKTVRRILQKRPPEELPAGAEDRLRTRLDHESRRRGPAGNCPRPPASGAPPTKARKTSTRCQR
jgi:hypothetical protein